MGGVPEQGQGPPERPCLPLSPSGSSSLQLTSDPRRILVGKWGTGQKMSQSGRHPGGAPPLGLQEGQDVPAHEFQFVPQQLKGHRHPPPKSSSGELKRGGQVATGPGKGRLLGEPSRVSDGRGRCCKWPAASLRQATRPPGQLRPSPPGLARGPPWPPRSHSPSPTRGRVP